MTINKENCKRQEHPNAKSKNIVISIRINKSMSEFIKKNGYSPSLIFYESLNELGMK